MNRHSALAPLAIFVAALAWSPAASAGTRYADDTGTTGVAPCETQSTPCPLALALSLAQPGETVSVAPGTYTSSVGFGLPVANTKIVGQSGGAKPTLRFTGPTALFLGGAGTEARNLVVESTGLGLAAIFATSNNTISDVDVSSSTGCITLQGSGATIENSKLTTTGTAPSGCLAPFIGFADNTTVRNVEVKSTATTPSLVPAALVTLNGSNNKIDGLVAENPVGPAVALGPAVVPGGLPSVMRRARISGASVVFPSAVLALNGGPLVTDTVVRASGNAFPATAISSNGATLRNVTAVATGTGSRGLYAPAFPFPIPSVTSVKNSIFRGDATDVAVDPTSTVPPGCTPGPGCTVFFPAGDVTITHSNFRASTGPLNAASGDNQAADPLFTDATGGNFRPLAGSPAIDAGTDDSANGTQDLDGRARKIGSAVDIGAYEFDPPPPPAPQQPSAPANTGEPTNQPAPLVVDRTAPLLAGVAITNKTFAVGSAATPVAARAKKGTTFVYTLSEPAVVTVTVQRAAAGRRKGSSCVKPTRKLRKAKKCTRYTAVGSIRRNGAAAANALPFSGRIGTKALKPGTYRAEFGAVDLAGNAAKKTATVGFKIVKK